MTLKRADPLLICTTSWGYHHWCPACERLHPLQLEGWQFNENFGRPTFTPDFKQTFSVILPRDVAPTYRTCHYFITDGRIQFCPDSWHGRSDIVAMPPIPVDQGDDFA